MEELPGKVLHILSGDLWGGAEAQTFLQLRALRKRGWTIEVLLFNARDTAHRFKSDKFNCTVIEESLGIRNLLQQAAAHFACNPSDIVAAHGYKSAFVAWWITRGSKIPWVVTYHGFTENNQGFAALRMKCYHALKRFLAIHSAAGIISVSKNLSKKLNFTEQPHLAVIRNVYAAEQYETASEREQQLFTQRPAVTIVGRLVPVKRIDRAIEAFSLLAKQRKDNGQQAAHLYLVGEGPERAAIEELVKAHGLNDQVHFLGFQDQAARFIAKADVLLLSSDSEGIPTVLLEAIYYGTPVVATSVGGIPEVVELLPEYPTRLTERNPEQIAEALQELLESGDNRTHALSQRTLFDTHFSPEVAAKQLDELYRSILQRCAGRNEQSI